MNLYDALVMTKPPQRPRSRAKNPQRLQSAKWLKVVGSQDSRKMVTEVRNMTDQNLRNVLRKGIDDVPESDVLTILFVRNRLPGHYPLETVERMFDLLRAAGMSIEMAAAVLKIGRDKLNELLKYNQTDRVAAADDN